MTDRGGNERELPDSLPATPLWHPTAKADDDWPEAFVTAEVDWSTWSSDRAVPGKDTDSGPTWSDSPWDPAGEDWPDDVIPSSWPDDDIDDSAWLLPDEPTTIAAEPEASEDLDLSRPLPPSGKAWPPASRTLMAIDQVELPRFAPLAVGFALTALMSLLMFGLISNLGRLHVDLTNVNGRGPATSTDVVRAYLQSLADGDAAVAASYLAQRPGNDQLLTNAVLHQSAKDAPFTVVSVADSVTSPDGGEQVEATYRLGDNDVTSTFQLIHRNGGWRLSGDPGTLGLASLRPLGSKLFVNDVEIPQGIDTLAVFPGVYTVRTSNRYLDYAGSPRITVNGPNAAPIIGGARLRVTDDGLKSVEAAVNAAVAQCKAKQQLKPEGCPQSAQAKPGEPVVANTISWTIDSESITMSPTPRNAVVEVSHTATWRITVDVMSNGRQATVTAPYELTSNWTVDLTQEPLTAILDT